MPAKLLGGFGAKIFESGFGHENAQIRCFSSFSNIGEPRALSCNYLHANFQVLLVSFISAMLMLTPFQEVYKGRCNA